MSDKVFDDRVMDAVKRELMQRAEGLADLDRAVEEAARHGLRIASATWDGQNWHAHFTRTGG